ncbi:hypothetical protein GGX14DRAFT_450350 [Mycena pura]|uniref:Uncharacterized protein n=1 Tax=Mycena pura TaxID=153505 RepID=A0AAD6VIW4_9AGAR|nr:hypothetical protein GGX14DRAFT_450350 [Mycena pura]
MLFAKALLFAGLLVPTALAAPSQSADVVNGAIAVIDRVQKLTDAMDAAKAAAKSDSAAVNAAATHVQTLKTLVMPASKLTPGSSAVVGNTKKNGILGASLAGNQAALGSLAPGKPFANALNTFSSEHDGDGDDDGSDLGDLLGLLYGLEIVLSDLVNAVLYLLLAIVALVNDCPYAAIYDLLYAVFDLLQAIAELLALALSYGAGSYSDDVISAINAAL